MRTRKRTSKLWLTMLASFVPVTLVGAEPSRRGYVDRVYVPQVAKVLLFGGQAGYRPPYQALGETWWYDPRPCVGLLLDRIDR